MVRSWMMTSQGQGFRLASDEQKATQQKAMAEAHVYFERMLRDRVDHPRDDMLTEIVRRKLDRDGQLDLYYLVGEVTTIYSAAYHNTVYMLASTMELLLDNPDQMQRLLDDPTLIRGMIDESLRLQSPVQWLQRVVTEDTELGGVELAKGSVCLVLWGSGNRDEERFPDPERFPGRSQERVARSPRVRFRHSQVPRGAPRPAGRSGRVRAAADASCAGSSQIRRMDRSSTATTSTIACRSKCTSPTSLPDRRAYFVMKPASSARIAPVTRTQSSDASQMYAREMSRASIRTGNRW